MDDYYSKQQGKESNQKKERHSHSKSERENTLFGYVEKEV